MHFLTSNPFFDKFWVQYDFIDSGLVLLISLGNHLSHSHLKSWIYFTDLSKVLSRHDSDWDISGCLNCCSSYVSFLQQGHLSKVFADSECGQVNSFRANNIDLSFDYEIHFLSNFSEFDDEFSLRNDSELKFLDDRGQKAIVFVSQYDIPVFNDVFKDMLSHVLSECFWKILENVRLPNSSEVTP